MDDWWERIGPDWRILLMTLGMTAPAWLGLLIVSFIVLFL